MSAQLADLDHWLGNDLVLANTGDYSTVTGTLRGQQRVVRRLLTNPGDYIFEPDYGAGLPGWIGRPLDIPKIQSLCIAQMLLEDVVAKTPTPTVTISQSASDLTAILVNVGYMDEPTLTPVVLSFIVS